MGLPGWGAGSSGLEAWEFPLSRKPLTFKVRVSLLREGPGRGWGEGTDRGI